MHPTNRLLELELYPHVVKKHSDKSNIAIHSAIESFRQSISCFFPHWYNYKFQLWRWTCIDMLMWRDPGRLWGVIW